MRTCDMYIMDCQSLCFMGSNSRFLFLAVCNFLRAYTVKVRNMHLNFEYLENEILKFDATSFVRQSAIVMLREIFKEAEVEKRMEDKISAITTRFESYSRNQEVDNAFWDIINDLR